MPDESATLERPAPHGISDAEWNVRVQLAAAYRLLDYYDWTEQIYGHLTARVPGLEDNFLINRWGLNYDEVTASNLVKIDVEGNLVSDGEHAVNYAGFVIHSAIHMTRSKENHVVMHTHTRAGMAIAAIKEGLLTFRCSPRSFITSSAITTTRAPRCIWTSASASCVRSGRTRRWCCAITA